MKLLRNIISAHFIFLLLSCSDNEVIVDPPDPTIKNNYSISKSSFTLDKTTNDQKYFLVGYGYDAKENIIYIHKGIRGRVLDVSKIPSDKLEINKLTKETVVSKQNTTLTELLSLLKISSHFSSKAYSSIIDLSEKLPSKEINYEAKQYAETAFKINSTYKITKDVYDEAFTYALANSSAQEIINKFGTHLIVDCTKGYSQQTISFIESQTNNDLLITKNWKTYIFSAGNDPSKITINDGVINWSEWQKSYTTANAEFVNFNSSQPIAIYEIMEDGEKKNQVKQYIENYLK